MNTHAHRCAAIGVEVDDSQISAYEAQEEEENAVVSSRSLIRSANNKTRPSQRFCGDVFTDIFQKNKESNPKELLSYLILMFQVH